MGHWALAARMPFHHDGDMSAVKQRWVVGHDGSAGAAHALEWSIAHAAGRATEVHVVRAWHGSAITGAAMMPPVDLDLEPETALPDEEFVRGRLAAVGVELTTELHHGVTADVLLGASARARLLVLGTRGLGGFGRLVVGSVGHQCATHALVPVAVVPPSAALTGDVKRVVVGMDGSAGAFAALRWAAEFVPPRATIQVVGAWQPSSWGASLDLYLQAADHEAAHRAFDQTVDDVEASVTGPTFERHFAGGHAADVLLDAAGGADLIVVGERGHRGLKASLLGSTATEVLHRAELTTVIVPAAHTRS